MRTLITISVSTAASRPSGQHLIKDISSSMKKIKVVLVFYLHILISCINSDDAA